MVSILVPLIPFEVGALTAFLCGIRWKDIFSGRVAALWRKK